MKKSISYWSFKGGLEGTASLADCFREAKSVGFKAVEPALGDTGDVTPKTTRKECAGDRRGRQARRRGDVEPRYGALLGQVSHRQQRLRARGGAGYRQGPDREGGVARPEHRFLVVPGAVDVFFLADAEKVPYDAVYERSLKAVKKLAKTAKKHKVRIGVENVWNKFLLSPQMRDFIDAVDSKYVGAYFDAGNVMLTGFPQHWIEILGKRIVRVHIKDFKTSVGTAAGFVDLLEGDVPWPAVMKALRKVRYNSYITAEMIPWKEGLLGKTSKAMDKILA